MATTTLSGKRAGVDADLERLKGFLANQDWRRARPLTTKLTKRAPDNIRVRYMAAQVALMGDRDPLRAKRLLESVLKDAPQTDAAWSLLAFAHNSMGDAAGAEAALLRALEIDPKNGPAHYSLVRTAPHRGPEVVADIEALLRRSDVEPLHRSALLTARGMIFEREASYDAAFYAFLKAKKALRSTYHAEAHDARFAAARSILTPSLFAGRRGDGLDDRRMIFIVGMPRSGTTLIEEILAAHPQIEGCGEQSATPLLVREMLEDPSVAAGEDAMSGPVQRLASTPAAQLRRLGKTYLDAVRPCVKDPSATRWIDKLPGNFRDCGLIALMFPKAKIIFTARDPRDVALSCLSTSFSVHPPFLGALERIAHFQALQRAYFRHWRAALGDQVIEVRYEDLVEDVEGVARRLLEHVGLGWDPACAAPHLNRSTILTASLGQVRRPVSSKSVGKWRRYERHFADFPKMIAAFEERFDAP